ncbi:hypothetical protein O1611_g9241 [Lasiodiplodia mahajangana]|uniref:Uncharacterized protein n=1 Tax=Lasiodiplodia mahajangana TaxID=1108764 RepID=A0ACC2JA63_9PEZI|nr:hypothetical protein O1611_g9241 [Lasiodiplodia mahajangana]
MAFEQTRDLRSGAHETKRVKDHAHKWARGKRASPGVKMLWLEHDTALTGSKEQQEKVRPDILPSKSHIRPQNITKPSVGGGVSHNIPQSYWWPKSSALIELQDPSNMSRSLHELLPSQHTQRKQSVSDDFIYSFDQTESPGKPLSLDVFVKTNTKATEKFVEKEYEILDYNGDPVKGRKALKDLHRGKMAPPTAEAELVEDEGFELV